VKYHPKTKPFKHQSRATIAAVKQRNHAVFFEPRLGKTKVALDWVAILALKGEVKRVLVLAPRIALAVWETEIHKHFPLLATGETFTERWVFNQDPPRGSGYTKRHPVHFFLAGREEVFRATRVAGGRLARPKQDTIQSWRPDAIIIDESHEYKRPGGRAAQDAWRLVRRLRSHPTHNPTRPYVLILTGTPSARGWRDIFAQFRIMDPQILGTAVGRFDERYCVYGVGPRKYTVIRYRNLSELTRRIDAHSSQCTASEAGLAGRLSFSVIPYQLPQKVRDSYDELVEEYVTEIDGVQLTAANQGVKRLRLLQLCTGYLTDGHEIHRQKVDAVKAWLQLLCEQGQYVVCYARFTAEVDAVWQVAKGVGYRCERVDGRTRQRDRTEAIARFQEQQGHHPRALVFQYQSGSRSIELSAAAEVVFSTLPDGWVDFWQCLNRVRGPNQTRPVRITAICGAATVERSVLGALRRKEDIHRAIMKDPGRFLRGDYH
jgi:hypothetical protein